MKLSKPLLLSTVLFPLTLYASDAVEPNPLIDFDEFTFLATEPMSHKKIKDLGDKKTDLLELQKILKEKYALLKSTSNRDRIVALQKEILKVEADILKTEDGIKAILDDALKAYKDLIKKHKKANGTNKRNIRKNERAIR